MNESKRQLCCWPGLLHLAESCCCGGSRQLWRTSWASEVARARLQHSRRLSSRRDASSRLGVSKSGKELKTLRGTRRNTVPEQVRPVLPARCFAWLLDAQRTFPVLDWVLCSHATSTFLQEIASRGGGGGEIGTLRIEKGVVPRASCDRRGIWGGETYSTDARGVRIFKFKYLSTRIGQLDYCTAEYLRIMVEYF